MATVILSSQDDVAPKPDGKEIVDLRWFSFSDAAQVIRATNHSEKADLLLKALSKCKHDLTGWPSPQERAFLSKA